MTNFEKLVNEIMTEAEKDGEPVTRAEAEEMAEMELGAKDIKRYEQSTTPRKKSTKERKVDEVKKMLLDIVEKSLIDYVTIKGRKTETEINFDFEDFNYTIKLTRHKNKKWH